MAIRMRTVIFQNTVEIGNVPVFSCESCGHSEVLPAVKPVLAELIGTLRDSPEKRQIRFDEVCELARLLIRASSSEHQNDPVELMIDERINELLDLLLLSQSLGDKAWRDDIRGRLAQLTATAISVHDLT